MTKIKGLYDSCLILALPCAHTFHIFLGKFILLTTKHMGPNPFLCGGGCVFFLGGEGPQGMLPEKC